MSAHPPTEPNPLIEQLLRQRSRGGRDALDDVLAATGVSNDPVTRASLLAEISRHIRKSAPNAAAAPSDAAGSLPPPPRSHGLPDIPGYDLIEEVGRGGMGVVYDGYQQSTGRRVAVKFISEHVAANDAVRRRFEREVELVARLQHPGIVSVLDSGTHAGHRFCVQEFVDGVTLDRWLAGPDAHAGPPPAARLEGVLHLLADVCDAMEYAHQRGVLHRDLKPSNILVDTRGKSHIVDFGLAKDIDPLASQWRDQTVGEPGEILGTLGYMSPEQARGSHDLVSIRSDIYSLGAIAYEAVTGRLPCPTGGALHDLLSRIEREDPPRPSSLNRALSADLDAVLLRALDKDAQRRYASAAELRDDLRRVLAREPVLARPVGRVARVVRWARRRPSQAALLAAVVGFVLALAATGVWLNARRAATARAVENDLGEIAMLQQRSAWADATAVLERARVRVGDGGGLGALRGRLDEAARNLALVTRLDAIRMDRANFVGVEQSIAPQLDADYELAFARAGLSADHGDPAALAERIRASGVRAPIANALMDWVAATSDPARKDWIGRLAQFVDPDAWRDRMHDPDAWAEPASLAEWGRTVPVSGQPVQTLMALGERLNARGVDGAPFLRRVQRRYPDDFWTNFYLGAALVSNPLEAISYYRAALALRPNAAPVHSNLAMALADIGRHDEAFDHFEAAARLTDYPSAHVNLANAFRRKGDHVKAVMHYERALRAGVSSYALHHNYGAALREGGRLDEAVVQYREAMRLNRRTPAVHVEIAAVLADLGQLDEAVGHVREATRLAPADWTVLERLHPLLLRQKRWEDARLAWKTTLDADPPEHRAWHGYAELCLYLNQAEEYQQARRALLARFASTSDPLVAERVGRACLLMPAAGEELAQAVALCDRALEDPSPPVAAYRPYFQFAKGLAEYRQDHLDRAVELMQGDASRVLGPAPRLVVALAQQREGRVADANETLDAAIASFDWSDAAAVDDSTVWMFHVLRREAQSLIDQN